MQVLFEILLSPFFLFLQWLAEEDVLFTTCKEGTAKAVMRGDSFDRFIMSFSGYHLNDPSKPWYDPKYPAWEVLYHGRDKDEGYDDRNWIERRLGLYWVGFPWANSMYVYQFEWNETYTVQKEAGEDEGKERVLARDEATDFVYVADFPYAMVTDRAETEDRLTTDELTIVTVAVRNPYTTLFASEDWMRRTTAAVNRNVRTFVGSKGYDKLISIAKDKEATLSQIQTQWAEEFSKPIIELTERMPDDKPENEVDREGRPYARGLHQRYGIVIRTADLQSVELSGTPEMKRDYQQAASKIYVARQTAEATRITGQASADVIKMTGDREAEALTARLKVIEEHGEAGIRLAGYDAIQEASKGPGNTIVWANNPLAPLAEMLKPKENEGGERV